MDTVEKKVSVREQVASEKDELSKKRKHQLADTNMLGFPLVQEREDSEGDFPKDTDKPMAQKFKTYELTLKDIQNTLMYWDRKQGLQLPHGGADDTPREPEDQRQVPSGGRRGRKERERAEKERLERERAKRERLEKLRALEDRSDGGEGDTEEEHEGKKDLGVPLINIQTPDFEGLSWKQALENDRLPQEDQVQTLPQREDVASGSSRCANVGKRVSWLYSLHAMKL